MRVRSCDDLVFLCDDELRLSKPICTIICPEVKVVVPYIDAMTLCTALTGSIRIASPIRRWMLIH